jgi:O-antigen/teichoic acid export membrane protein
MHSPETAGPVGDAGDIGATLRRAGWLLRVRVIQYVLVFAGGLVIARSLGPDGRGEYALALNLATIAWVVFHLSIESAIARLLARKEATAFELTRLSVQASLVLGGAGALAALATGLATRDSLLDGASTTAIALAAATVPPSVAGQLFAALLLRRGQLRAFGYGQAGLATAQFALLTGTALTGALTPESTLLINLVATAGLAVAMGVVLARDLSPRALVPVLPLRWSLRAVRLGASLHPASVGAYLNLRIDLLLVGAVLDARRAGLYSLAVVLAELVAIATTTVATSALQGQSELDRHAAVRYTLAFVRQSFAAALVLSVPVALAAYPFVVFVYGDEWRGSVLSFVILLVALLALVIESPVRNLLLRVGRPWSISAAAFGAMLVNVALNLALLPVLGIAGAALASTVSYWLAAGLMLSLLARRTEEPVVASLLRPQPGDLVGMLGRRGIAWLAGRRGGTNEDDGKTSG